MSLNNTSNFIKFLVKRYLRLFPLMFISSILIFVLHYFSSNLPVGKITIYDAIPGFIFVNPTIINKLTGLSLKSLDGVFWSLYVEVIFYALCCLYFTKYKTNIIQILMCIFMISILFFVINLFTPFYLFGVIKLLGFHFYGWFILGIFLYKYKNTYRNLFFIFFPFLVLTSFYSSYVTGLEHQSVISKFILFLFVGFIFIFSFYSKFIQNILTYRYIVFFGYISYPLYLFHQQFIVSLSIDLFNLYPFLNPLFYPSLFIALSICVCFILQIIDNKIQKLFRFYVR